MKENTNISLLCDELLVKEQIYLNPGKISKSQIENLIKKLYSNTFKNKENKENQNSDAGRKQNYFDKK